MNRVLVIGAGGKMTRRFLSTIVGFGPSALRFTLADVDEVAAQEARAGFPVPDAHRVVRFDLYDDARLVALVAEHDFVVNGAGPFHQTAPRVRQAAIAGRTHYFDIDDDVESGENAVQLSGAAAQAGVGLFVGHGASPGFTNVLALDLIRRIERPLDVEVAWCVGDEGPQELGRSVIEHTLHILAGDCVTWRDCRRVVHPSFEASTVFPLPGLPKCRLYECPHPETIMLPHSCPQLRNVTCWGGLDPAPVNGMLREVARAERAGRVTRDAAIKYCQSLIAGRATDKNLERIAWEGLRRQRRDGEVSWAQVALFLIRAALHRPNPLRGGIAARVRGWDRGRFVELSRAADSAGAPRAMLQMDVTTGVAEAAFFSSLIERQEIPTGCRFPESWVEPDQFYERYLCMLGMHGGSVVTPVQESILDAGNL